MEDRGGVQKTPFLRSCNRKCGERRRKAAQEDGLKENEANGIHRIQSGKKQPNALEDKRAAFQKFVWNTAAKRELQKCCREKKSMVCRKISHWNKG